MFQGTMTPQQQDGELAKKIIVHRRHEVKSELGSGGLHDFGAV